MKIILTRHGETEENKQGILQGHIPGKLSGLGKEQARKLAGRLKDEKIDYIYSSDLSRAADTARIISKYHPDIPIKIVKEMREKDLGELTGKRKIDLGINPEKMVVSSIEPEGGESTKDMYNRAKAFIESIVEKHGNDTVLLVGHNGIGMAIISVLLGKKATDVPKLGSLSNTSISVFERKEDGTWNTGIYDSTSHLK